MIIQTRRPRASYVANDVVFLVPMEQLDETIAALGMATKVVGSKSEVHYFLVGRTM